MPLVRMWCDKQTCAFNENGQCVSPEMPRWTTPGEVTVEDCNGVEHTGSNDEYMTCDRFIRKG